MHENNPAEGTDILRFCGSLHRNRVLLLATGPVVFLVGN